MSAAAQSNGAGQSLSVTAEQAKKLERYLLMPERRARLLALAERDPVKLERILVVAQKAVATDEGIAHCTIESILEAVSDAVELGLEPNGISGEGYFVAYRENVAGKNEVAKWEDHCKFMPSYRGKAKLALDNGWDVFAEVVCDGDVFEHDLGLKPYLRHVLPENPKDRGRPLYYYALATHMATGYTKRPVVMSVAQVEAIRQNFSKAKDAKAWSKSFDEMAKKTVIHRLEKMLPCSPKMNRAREIEFSGPEVDESETVRARVVPDNEPPAAGVPAKPPDRAAEGSGANAADGGGAPTSSPATGSASSPAPAPSRTKKSKVTAAMEESKNVSACPDCIPGQPPCAKHSVVGYISPEDQRRLEEQNARANGLPGKDFSPNPTGSSAQVAQPASEAPSRGQAPGEKGTASPGELYHGGLHVRLCPDYPSECRCAERDDLAKTNRAQSEIEATISRGAKRCDKTAGCAQDLGHAGFCAGPCKKTQGCAYWNKHPGECKP